MYLQIDQYAKAIQYDIERDLKAEQKRRERDEYLQGDSEPAPRQPRSWNFVSGFLALFTHPVLNG